MNTPTLRRQLFGAFLGIMVAGVGYVLTDEAALHNMQAYLITPGQNIANESGAVRSNRPGADPELLGRVARQAQQVTAALKDAAATPGTPQTALNLHAEARAELRAHQQDIVNANADAPIFDASRSVVSEEERLAIRAARTVAAMQDTSGTAPVRIAKPETVSASPEQLIREAITTANAQEPVITTETHSAAPEMHTSGLPDSGPAMNAAILIAGVLALMKIKPEIRKRFLI